MEIGVQLGRVAERTWMSDRLRRSAGEAVAANQAKTTFLANMSHELRTPLNAIIGFSELIKAEIFGPVGATEYADYVSDIHDSGKHLLQIINDVLDMAKIESGQLEPSFRDIDMAHIAETCVSMSSVLADKGDVALTTNIPNDLPEVLADSRMMKQIILNLLSNGIKFTPAQGNVVLSIAADKAQGCVIEVRDDGIGMDPADLDIIMQPFGQVDTNLNRENEGTGLGLPLVKSMVELHDGSVEIDTQLGRGTAVIITLPPERLADNVRDLLNSSAANG
jgi:signal transduction histidine kinase